jgi:TetR/AcrR family transcriptional regulator
MLPPDRSVEACKERRLTADTPSLDRSRDQSSRDKILEVAEALYARRGYAGVGMREVADAAGLGKSSLFHHFRSKVQLYLAVLERVLGRLDDRLGDVLSQDLPPAEKLDRWMDAAIDTFAEQSSSARILLRALFEDDEFDGADWSEGQAVDARLASVLEGVSKLLADGMRDGSFRRASVPHVVQTLIGGALYHFASGELGETLLGAPLLSAESVRARKEEMKAFLHHGLAPRPGEAQGGDRS